MRGQRGISRCGKRRRQPRERRGGVIMIMAIVLFVLIAFCGLAIDWGYITWTAQKLQTTADAAALAGAQQVWGSHTKARIASTRYAALNEAGGKLVTINDNEANDPAGDVVIGKYDRTANTFTPTDSRTDANAVRVVARRTAGSASGALPLIFGPIFGKSTSDVARYGIAVAIGGPAAASVIALNSKDPQSFYVYGHGYMDLGDGAAQVDSSNNAGAEFQGTNLTFLAGQVNMVGSWDERGNPNLNSVDLNPYEPTVADPLASLPVPTIGSPMNPKAIDPSGPGLATYNPGYYPNGLHLNNGENVFLNPGVYILESGSKKPSDPSFEINGHANLTGYGVMFYIKNGSVKHNGTGDVYLTPPQSGVYKGIQFFQARDDTQMASFNGTGLFTGTGAGVDSGAGTLYFPKASVELGGTGDMYIDSIIADKITVYGDGRKTVTKGYDGRKGGDKVYIVE